MRTKVAVIAAVLLAASLGYVAGRSRPPSVAASTQRADLRPLYTASHSLQSALEVGVLKADYGRYVADLGAKLEMAKESEAQWTEEQKKALDSYSKAYEALRDANTLWELSSQLGDPYYVSDVPPELISRYGLKAQNNDKHARYWWERKGYVVEAESSRQVMWHKADTELKNGDAVVAKTHAFP